MKVYYEDNEIVVLEKPYGASSQESNGVSVLSLLKEMGIDAFCVHRLDTQTTGVMVYAKTSKSASFLSSQMSNRQFYKQYLAVCHGIPQKEGEMLDILYHDKFKNKSFVVKNKRTGCKEARLEFWTQGSLKIDEKELSLVKILLHTGRTHQIRVQLSSRGYPLYGDGKYGAKDNGRIALHCHKIRFTHPNGKEMEFVSIPEGEIWDLEWK